MKRIKAVKGKPKKPLASNPASDAEIEYKQKKLVFYETLLSHSLDNDKLLVKQILTTSLLAIGLMMTIFTNNETKTPFLLWIWVIAEASFLILALILFKNLIEIGNLYHVLLARLQDPDSPDIKENEKEIRSVLKRCTFWIYILFFIAIAFSVIYVLFSSNIFSSTVAELITLPTQP